MDYRQHIANGSMLKRHLGLYLGVLLTLRWLKSLGGVAAIENVNIQKATVVSNVDSRRFLRHQ